MNFLALLPNLAGPDMIIIFLIVLIMFGAKKLPELAKGLGQAVREFSKAKDDMNSELHRTVSVEPQISHPAQDHPYQAPAASPTVAPAPQAATAIPGTLASHEVAPATASAAAPAPAPAAQPGVQATPHA